MARLDIRERMNPCIRYILLALLLAAGCRGGVRAEPPVPRFAMAPLPVQQVRAYPEAAGGRFISLADFEHATLLDRPGHEQVKDFSIVPAGAGGRLAFVVNVTRTGAGALAATLPGGTGLEYRLPKVHDFSKYTLLSLSIHSRGIRDDLKVRIATDRAAWESLPVLLRAGWNTVRIDLQRLKRLPDFEARGVRTIRLWFAAAGAGGPDVRIGLDDILLIDNRRPIGPVPAGMRLDKAGMDYTLRLPGRREPVGIAQSDDGLWRLGADQTILEVMGAGTLPAPAEKAEEVLDCFSRRRVGEVEVLEHNAIRLRIANVWYFPTSAGQWASLAVPQIRWEYTFYRDGRQVTDVTVNNAGSEEISAVRVTAPAEGAWADGSRGRARLAARFSGVVGRWSFLIAGPGRLKKDFEANYLEPAAVRVRIGTVQGDDGDSGGDGFDESQGCYRLRARAGNCRFTLTPPRAGLAEAVVCVAGRWAGPVSASCDGLALRNLVRLPGGAALFVVPGLLTRPADVEVTGPAPRAGAE